MSDIPLFEVNPALDRAALRSEFARNRRIQIRNVLTEQTAAEVRKILAQHTPWALAWQAGHDGPHVIRREEVTRLTPERSGEISRKVTQAIRGTDYAFVYSSYPMLDAYIQKWDPGSPQDLLIEHINDAPFMNLVRDVTAMPQLLKADAQATLYGPGQFLAQHDDSHVRQGWQVAYVLNLTAGEWRPEWGGYLLFHDEAGDIVAGFKPRFNALNLFAVPQKHSVSYVPPFSPVGRFAITGWFRDR